MWGLLFFFLTTPVFADQNDSFDDLDHPEMIETDRGAYREPAVVGPAIPEELGDTASNSYGEPMLYNVDESDQN